MSVFEGVAAESYDALQAGKDYAAECALIQDAFRRHAQAPVRTVLDLGCGSGSHAVRLAEAGYQLTGVDRSKDMLARARAKSPAIQWIEADLRDFDAGGPFDAALCMYAVLGYLTTNDDVARALAAARRHLRPGGLFVFDVWYGPGVLAQPPSSRVKEIVVPGGRVLRASTPALDVRNHRCTVVQHTWRLEGDRVAGEAEETHVVRYFFPLELELFLSVAGFSLVSLSEFPDLDRPAGASTWNALVIARASAAVR